ncbi:hypothetical protein E2C01_012481 [Portunus trituberculatus]|uniref:Uncharacterized protein n=1 Tax=Portunus trituberculatus TaxID=210409 RepID=A0A5B7DDR8_PORTR|nr:hypothetical protein [Portunus trituberculatus]
MFIRLKHHNTSREDTPEGWTPGPWETVLGGLTFLLPAFSEEPFVGPFPAPSWPWLSPGQRQGGTDLLLQHLGQLAVLRLDGQQLVPVQQVASPLSVLFLKEPS